MLVENAAQEWAASNFAWASIPCRSPLPEPGLDLLPEKRIENRLVQSDMTSSPVSATPRSEQARLESGRFLIPAEAEWREDFLHEVKAFPSGRYDDQVDSLTQFLLWTGCAGGMA